MVLIYNFFLCYGVVVFVIVVFARLNVLTLFTFDRLKDFYFSSLHTNTRGGVLSNQFVCASRLAYGIGMAVLNLIYWLNLFGNFISVRVGGNLDEFQSVHSTIREIY